MTKRQTLNPDTHYPIVYQPKIPANILVITSSNLVSIPLLSTHWLTLTNAKTTMQYRFNKSCVCRNEECFFVQDQLCRFTGESSGGNAAVWCKPLPIKIIFDPSKSNYKTWLFLLSICHHIPKFQKTFIATMFSSIKGRKKQWFINRIHFPRALLENRATYEVLQNQKLLSPAVANRLTEFDGNKKRIVESVNMVLFLEKLAKRILPANAYRQFQKSKTETGGKEEYFVQAPVGTLHEAKEYISVLKSSGKLEQKPPPESLCRHQPPPQVMPSPKKAKLQQHEENPLHFFVNVICNAHHQLPIT